MRSHLLPIQPCEINLDRYRQTVANGSMMEAPYKHPLHGQLLVRYIEICQRVGAWISITWEDVHFVRWQVGIGMRVDLDATEESFRQLVHGVMLEKDGDRLRIRRAGLKSLYSQFPAELT